MQNDTDSDDMRKRSRYYQGLLDTPILKSGKNTRYKGLPATLITFITQDDIFKQDLAKYTFTEQCEEIAGLHLEDGTTKIFLNMTSKNGDAALVSMLQYMKKSDLNNPEIIVKDERIRKIDAVVTEVKESEEWEEVKMSILSYGIAQGREQGLAQGREQGIEVGIRALIKDNLDTGTGEAQIIEKLINLFSITPAQAKAYYDQFKSE
jgi:predicted transposase/invertase (TIGR01784 family)